MATEKKNEAMNPPVETADNWAIPSEYAKEQTGFPPYWSPNDDMNEGKGSKFACEVLGLDTSGDFDRYVLRATKMLTCERGDKNSKTKVIVNPGDLFTMSVYASLNLERYIGIGEIIGVVTGKQSVKSGDMYNWEVHVNPAGKKILAQRDKENPLQLAAKKSD